MSQRSASPGDANGNHSMKTQAEWFQERAADAWRRSQTAQSAGDHREAAAWLDRAHRIAPRDAAIALAFAGARIRIGDQAAAEDLLRNLTERLDLREIWLSLASVRRSRGDDTGAAAALGRALSGHALPSQSQLPAMADGIAADAGLAGWCGMTGDGRLVVHVPGRSRPTVLVDGVARRLTRQLVPQGTVRIEARLGDRELLGSPIEVAAIRRVEGIVRSRDGGLEGWAWHPSAPDTDPVLTVRSSDGGPGLTIIADDGSMIAPSPLARPRRFNITPDRIAGLSGLIHVLGADGRSLMGSPLDPGAERRAAIAISAAQAGHVTPAQAADALRVAAVAADIVGPPASARLHPNRPVVVIVPVYGNVPLVRGCLTALGETIPADTRVIIVDDASPDPAISELLAGYARLPRWRVLRHTANGGFPMAANTGLAAAAALPVAHDVVLLNSDALVSAGWLEALREVVHAAPNIGTATPLSNDATILSYPDVHGPNVVPGADALRRLQRWAASANAKTAVDIPTAVGFCMYIRQECLADVGTFRADIFAQGYGEENDFCIRARHLGWRHVAAPGVYVAHIGGQSFGMARAQLIARNLDALERLHPGYHDLIAAFQNADPLAEARRRIDVLRWRAGRMSAGAVLLITHDSGGGVERVVRERAAAIRATGRRAIVLRPLRAREGRDFYRHGWCRLDEITEAADAMPFTNLCFRVPAELPDLARLLRAEKITHVEAHHLLGHDHAVMRLPELLGVPVDTHVHDYALFCPRISLVGRDARYCGEPADAAACEACVADAGRNTTEDIPVATLRARSASDLAAARRIVVPSTDVATRLRRHFSHIAPVVEPLEDDAHLPPERSLRPGFPPNIGILGGIGTEKGYDILLACARNAAQRGLKLRFTVVGHTPDDGRLIDTGHVFVTGPYVEEEAIALIASLDIHFAWQPSIWPETWCFTLGLAWRAGLRVAAFDIGAPAERIRRTGRGWLLPLGLPPASINSALLGFTNVTNVTNDSFRLSVAGE